MFKQDKLKHFIAGMVISLIFVWVSPLAAILVVTFVGIAKEVYDSTGKGCVEGWDAAFTVFGGLPICILMELYQSLWLVYF